MNTCGTCRHWRRREYSPSIGTCEREDWTEVPPCKNPHEHLALSDTHYRHVLSEDHPAPPCHEAKAKRVNVYWGLHNIKQDVLGEGVRGKALDDIKKGEEVIIK